MIADDRKPPRGLSEEERALWNGVARSVSPLRRRTPRASRPAGEGEHKTRPTRPPASKATSATIVRPAPAAKTAAPSLMPIDRRLRQRIARGSAEIDARIDLHGRTQGQAHAALLRFLGKAQAQGAKLVLVITGKGDRDDCSSERGVLKRQVPLWLALPEFRGYVLGFEQAHVGHGGEGALYVRVRKAR